MLHMYTDSLKKIHQKSSGFTLIEVLVISPIIVLMIGGFVGIIVAVTGEVMSTRASNALTYNLQDALDRIENDISISTNFLPESDITPQSPMGYNDITANFSNVSSTTGDMLILKTLMTNKNPSSSDRGLIYLDDQPNDCLSADINYNSNMTAVIVYFTKDNTLWRRTITPSNYLTAGCPSASTPWQQPSCKPGIDRLSFCKTDDIRLLDGVAADGFNVDYFTDASSATANTTASDPVASPAARATALNTTFAVKVSLTGSQTVAGRNLSQAYTAMFTKINPPL